MKRFHGHNHGLKLSVMEDSGMQMCSVCELEVSGEAYSCCNRDCDFILHKSCSEMPKSYQHKSHPDHAFSLISEPPESCLYYDCDGCGHLITAFGFQCDECDRRMHVQCALLPESVDCKAHSHNLHLFYSTSDCIDGGSSFFSCAVCAGGLTRGHWVYYCKDCDFGTHVDCAAEAAAPDEEEKEEVDQEEDEENEVDQEEEEENGVGQEEEEENGDEDEEDLPLEVQLERARIRMEQQRINLDFQMQMARQNAEFMNSITNSWKGLF